MADNRITALLPMKLNSERVPGKNFREFAGKPLFMWILESLLSINDIGKIVINTDARSKLHDCGLLESDRIVIRNRPDELCGDMVDMNLVLDNDISNTDSDIYLMTHTTNPLLKTETIYNAIQVFKTHLEEGIHDSLFSVTRYQSRFFDSRGMAINHDPDTLIRTQDLPPLFEENSNLYLFTKASFSFRKTRIGSTPAMFEISRYESIDIDDEEDFAIAEKILKDTLTGSDYGK